MISRGLLDELALDLDLDLVANNQPSIKHQVERQAEIFAVDLALSAVSDAVAHVRVIEFPVLHHGKRHRPGIALDSQVASHSVAILSSRFNLCTFEGNGRIL